MSRGWKEFLQESLCPYRMTQQPLERPAGYRASEQAAQSEGDSGRGGILGGLLGGWGPSVPGQTRPLEPLRRGGSQLRVGRGS